MLKKRTFQLPSNKNSKPLLIYTLNEIGGRANNEDSIFVSEKLFMVCDGIGGSNKGEIASKMMCENFAKAIKEEKELNQFVINAIQKKVIKELNSYTSGHSESERMGTTLTLACFQENCIFLAWCGDSRIYHLRNGKILYQTQDHSYVQLLYDEGAITKEEMATHPRRNIILGSISANKEISLIATHEIFDFQTDHCFLLCSDGLLENISDAVLLDIFQKNDQKSGFSSIFNNYCIEKTKDNYSMILLIKQ
jgi:PPM family protein phosphatase